MSHVPAPERGLREGASHPPPCPRCHDRGFVQRERLTSRDGTATMTFWLCGSCLHLWPVDENAAAGGA